MNGTKARLVKSLLNEGKRIVAMCQHANSIFIATEHEIFRCGVNDDIVKQLTFELIDD